MRPNNPTAAPTRELRPGLACIDLPRVAEIGGLELLKLPRAHRILLENVVAHEGCNQDLLKAFADWLKGDSDLHEIPFRPGRILSHDTAGIAMLVDLAALRDKVAAEGGDPTVVNSHVPIDLVVDHSVAVDVAGSPTAMAENARRELARNEERYRFLRWAESAFDNLRIIPPGNGICHQVNMEFLARGISQLSTCPGLLLADTVIGTDSHTTMINALGILGWGVGGIEAEAVALRQPLIMSLPAVTGCRLIGQPGTTSSAADIVLSVVSALREHGVVGKFVEFYGDGLDHLPLGDRAAIANMAPEYGATCGLFPIDSETLRYLRETGRDQALVEDIQRHAEAAGLWRDDIRTPAFSDELTIDLSAVEPLVAGPRRPQEKVALTAVPQSFASAFPDETGSPVEGLANGDVVIAAITSCTHTSNPHLMVAAGLLARNARASGLACKPWVKTSLSPGSRVVAEYLTSSGLQEPLDELGFNVVGFGCMTCAGNSGALAPEFVSQIRERNLTVCAVLSANRNFEGRTHPQVRACYLAAPALVVAYALAGTIKKNLLSDPLGWRADGSPIMLEDIWPAKAEVEAVVRRHLGPGSYRRAYAPEVMAQNPWYEITAPTGPLFKWDEASTHVRRPPFLDGDLSGLSDIAGARPLAVLGDNITTDHISPFGRILPGSAAAEHLQTKGVGEAEWSSYAERRGNHEVLRRGAFSNPQLRNLLVEDLRGGMTMGPTGEPMKIFDAAEAYRAENAPTVIFAGRAYGTGSARDWAAKATLLLGVKAVIAESFERIHRGNLVGVGVLPCQLPEGTSVTSLGIGPETRINIEGLPGLNGPRATLRLVISQPNGETSTVPVTCRLDTQAEVDQFRQGGLFAEAERTARAASS